jgi:quercetin dioxygenase-like cupin family protein
MKMINQKYLTFALFAIIVSLPTLSTANERSSIINIPKDNYDWKVTPEGAAFSALKGDRFKESYMAMVKLPAGIVSPMHVKSANMFGVVISGTFSHIAEGADPSTEVMLPAGSYYMIPAGLAHISKCVSKTECVSFLYQDGKFDFNPVVN